MITDIYNTDKKYGIILTDPPWRQGRGNKMRRLKKNNKGFCGYDWMVRSIIATGEIKK